MDVKNAFLYALSLPERTVRSASAAAGGVSKLLTDSLLPESVRDMTIYRVMIGNTQRFVIERLGQVKMQEGEKLPDDFVARKIVGNAVDAAAIFAFRFSPLWVFALVGDAADGTRSYLKRIVEELKKDGVIEPDTQIESADHLMEALAKASAKSAAPLDVPPLSKEELETLKDEIRKSYGDVGRASLAAIPSLDQTWEALMELRNREKLPLLRLSGAMALGATRSVGRATGAMFWEKVVSSYGESMESVRKEGFRSFLSRVSAPYLEAVSRAFSMSKGTLTERFLGKKDD